MAADVIGIILVISMLLGVSYVVVMYVQSLEEQLQNTIKWSFLGAVGLVILLVGGYILMNKDN